MDLITYFASKFDKDYFKRIELTLIYISLFDDTIYKIKPDYLSNQPKLIIVDSFISIQSENVLEL